MNAPLDKTLDVPPSKPCPVCRPYDGPAMLYRVLLDEYREIEVFDGDDKKAFYKYYDHARKQANILPYEEAKKLPLKQRNEQFALRQRVRFEAMAKIRALVHAKPPIAALCLSGGGIRSATFSLGVIQSLAKAELLPKFNYLSSVSRWRVHCELAFGVDPKGRFTDGGKEASRSRT
jgi:hypothetical protein